MKKNTMMRIASFLLIAVLITTSTISGTYAKYVTKGTATDTARVAEWGVTITAEGNEAFGLEYEQTPGDGGKTVSSKTTDNVIAPGTDGSLGRLTITGQPEVEVNVVVGTTLTLTGWKIKYDVDSDPATPDEEIEYCPIVFTVNGATYGTNDTDATNKYASVNELITAIEGLLDKTENNIPAQTNLATTYDLEIEWEWEYQVDDVHNVKDTKLGNLGTLPTISFEVTASVTQVD